MCVFGLILPGVASRFATRNPGFVMHRCISAGRLCEERARFIIPELLGRRCDWL